MEQEDYEHSKAFDELTEDGVFIWVRPDELIRTHDSDFNSVLDFVFVSNAFRWDAESEIIVREGDLPDDETTSDHRPVKATFALPEEE